MVYAHQRYSDKPYMGSVTAPSRAQDTVDMSKILFGEEFVANNTVISSLINANSPMTWDDTMLGALKVYARNNQAVIISPFILAGAMSPVSVAGTLAQTLAEAMSGIAFTQAVKCDHGDTKFILHNTVTHRHRCGHRRIHTTGAHGDGHIRIVGQRRQRHPDIG